MSDDRNISEELSTASYLMAHDGEFFLAGERQFTLGDARVEVRDREIYVRPPFSPGQEEGLIEQAESLAWPLYVEWSKRQNPLWLPIILEGLETIEFRNEVTGAYSGQINGTLYAEEGDRTIGNVDYVVYDGEINISMIFVDRDKRRGGIATMLLKKLQAAYPDANINFGYTTPEGTAFLKALDRSFEPDPTYEELHQLLADATGERNALQAEFDAQDFTTMPQDQKAAWVAKGEQMNDLETLIWSLEDQLRHLKPGKWHVKESEEPDMSKLIKRTLSIHGEWKIDVSQDAAVPHTTYALEFVDPQGRFKSHDTRAIILDYGPIGEGPSENRMVWFRMRIASMAKETNLFDEDRDQAPWAFDKQFWMKPSEQEFTDFRQGVEQGFTTVFNRIARRHSNIHLVEHDYAFSGMCHRIVHAFEVDRWS